MVADADATAAAVESMKIMLQLSLPANPVHTQSFTDWVHLKHLQLLNQTGLWSLKALWQH